MIVHEIGEAAVAKGWRKKAADALAPRLARSPLPVREREIRAALGLVLLGLALRYVAGTAGRVRSATTSE